MKYKHPTLWREAIESRNTRWARYLVEEDWKRLMSCDNIGALTKLWFESVDEIPDWIQKAFAYYEKYRTWTDASCKIDRSVFYEAFTRHMPKQEKITIDDIEDWLRSIDTLRGYDYSYTHWFITNALRNKWLLQE